MMAHSVCTAEGTVSLVAWQRFVERHPDSTPLHDRRWIETLADQYGLKIFIPAIRREGKVVAATAFLETAAFLGGRNLISLPFTDCFTPLSSDEAALRQLLGNVKNTQAARYDSISIRSERAAEGYSHLNEWVRHRIQLTREMTDLLPFLTSPVRRNVRQAKARDLSYEQRTDLEAVEDFYKLHVLTRRKLGVPVQAASYFRRLFEYMIQSGLGHIGIVRAAAKPIAAAVFLEKNGVVIYKYGASDPKSLNIRPNDFLFLNAIQLAASSNHCFDFGATNLKDEGLRRFKRKWGAEEDPIYDICIAGKQRSAAANSWAVKVANRVIRRSPTLLCRVLGQLLYRYGA